MVRQQERRPVGRPPMTEEQRNAKEQTVDTHINLPKSIVNAVDRERSTSESRKDCIARLLRERLNMVEDKQD
jgi:hypothetical protein